MSSARPDLHFIASGKFLFGCDDEKSIIESLLNKEAILKRLKEESGFKEKLQEFLKQKCTLSKTATTVIAYLIESIPSLEILKSLNYLYDLMPYVGGLALKAALQVIDTTTDTDKANQYTSLVESILQSKKVDIRLPDYEGSKIIIKLQNSFLKERTKHLNVKAEAKKMVVRLKENADSLKDDLFFHIKEDLAKHSHAAFSSQCAFIILWQDLLQRIKTDGHKLSQPTKELLVTFQLLMEDFPPEQSAIHVFAGAEFNAASSKKQNRAKLLMLLLEINSHEYSVNSLAEIYNPRYYVINEIFLAGLDQFKEFLKRSPLDKRLFATLTKSRLLLDTSQQFESDRYTHFLLTCHEPNRVLWEIEGQPDKISSLLKNASFQAQLETRLLCFYRDTKSPDALEKMWKTTHKMLSKIEFSLSFYQQLLSQAYQQLPLCAEYPFRERGEYLAFCSSQILKKYPVLSIPFSDPTPMGDNLFGSGLRMSIETALGERSRPLLLRFKEKHATLLTKTDEVYRFPHALLKAVKDSPTEVELADDKMNPHNPFIPLWRYLIKKIHEDMNQKTPRVSPSTCKLFVIFMEAVRALQNNKVDVAIDVLLAGIHICKSSALGGKSKRADLLIHLLDMVAHPENNPESIVRAFAYRKFDAMISLQGHFTDFRVGLKLSGLETVFEAFSGVRGKPKKPVLFQSSGGVELRSLVPKFFP